VIAGSLFPGLGNNYAALGAWESQLTNLPLASNRKANLHRPVDDLGDFGAHGIFDDRAGGALDRSFLHSLPKVAQTFFTAWSRTVEDKAKRWVKTGALKSAGLR